MNVREAVATSLGAGTNWPAISALGPPIVFPPAFTLVRQRARIDAVYLLTSGVVKLLASVEGEDRLVGIRTPTWLLGNASAICGERHNATIIALSECEVRPLAVAVFQTLRRTDPAVSDWLQQKLSEELIDQLRRTAALTSDKHGEARLERLFVDLLAAAGTRQPDGSWKLMLGLTVTELGTLVGFGREWTSKILSKWQHNDRLQKRQGWFIVPAGSRLASLVEASEIETSRDR